MMVTMSMSTVMVWADDSGSGSTGTVITASDIEKVNYGYAYDVQRSPGFATTGNKIHVSGMTLAVDTNGSTTLANAGNWKLKNVGCYSKMTNPSNNLISIINDIKVKYAEINVNIDTNSVLIFELTESDKHIAYGVVIACESKNGAINNLLYIGDTLSGSGAGYFLSTSEQTASLDIIATAIATDIVETPKETKAISLDQTEAFTFAEATEGYTTPEVKAVTVTNTGNVETGALKVELSGENKDSFEIDKSAIESITTEGAKNASFTVTPRTGLKAGTYKATVTVSGEGIDVKSFDVSFTVKAKETTKPAGPEHVYVHYHTYDQKVVKDQYKKSDATCTAPAEYYMSCICGAAGTETFGSGEVNSEKHTGKLGEWVFDKDNHWKVYSCCNAVTEKGAHTWVNGVCSVCGLVSDGAHKISMDASFRVIRAKKSLKVYWGAVDGADGYDVVVRLCGMKNAKKYVTSIADSKATQTEISKIDGKKLNSNKSYRVYVVAYKMVDGEKVTIANTITAHCANLSNKTYTNVKGVKVSKSSFELSVGSTANIKARSVKVNANKKILGKSHGNEFRYVSTDANTAAVSKNGKITAVGAGSCTVYVYGMNGFVAAVDVTVK